MKTRNAITRLLTMALAVAALAAAGLLYGARLVQPVAAQTGDGSVRFLSYASIGIIPGQKVRVSMGNTEKSGGNLTWMFSLYPANGNMSPSSVPLYESEWMKVPPGEFRFADVSRRELKTEGEPKTGRSQMLMKITTIAAPGSSPDDVPASLEILEDEANDGTSEGVDFKYRLIIVAARRSKLDAPISLLPEQSLRYTFFNPDEEGSEPVRVSTYTYDAIGRLTSQTQPVELRPGESHTFEVKYDDVRMAAEYPTGRVQVRSGIQVVLMDGSVRTIKLHGSMEVVSSRTGSTVGSGDGDYFTGTVSVSGDGF